MTNWSKIICCFLLMSSCAKIPVPVEPLEARNTEERDPERGPYEDIVNNESLADKEVLVEVSKRFVDVEFADASAEQKKKIMDYAKSYFVLLLNWCTLSECKDLREETFNWISLLSSYLYQGTDLETRIQCVYWGLFLREIDNRRAEVNNFAIRVFGKEVSVQERGAFLMKEREHYDALRKMLPDNGDGIKHCGEVQYHVGVLMNEYQLDLDYLETDDVCGAISWHLMAAIHDKTPEDCNSKTTEYERPSIKVEKQ